MNYQKQVNKIIYDILNKIKISYNELEDSVCWVLYGSYAIHEETKNSDIDLLCINEKCEKPYRIGMKYENIEITIYVLSLFDLIEDSYGKYGGFFCGKLLNPSVLITCNSKIKKVMQTCKGNFVGKLMSSYFSNCIEMTDEDIIIIALKIYLKLYPDYFAYIMRIVKASHFEEIWSVWKKDIIDSLLQTNRIISLYDNKYQLQIVSNNEKFESLLIDYVSRFWSFGAVSHDGDIYFYDYYKKKNRAYIANNLPYVKKTYKLLKTNGKQIRKFDITVIYNENIH